MCVTCFHGDVYGMTWVWLVSSGYLLRVEPLQWCGHQPHHSHSQNKETRAQEICRQMCLQPRLKVSNIINVFFLIASFDPAFHLFLLPPPSLPFPNSLLATASADGTCKIWSTADFSLRNTLKRSTEKWVWDCSFSCDSQYIFTGQ